MRIDHLPGREYFSLGLNREVKTMLKFLSEHSPFKPSMNSIVAWLIVERHKEVLKTSKEMRIKWNQQITPKVVPLRPKDQR